jgi:hypothetical protein
MATQTGKLRQVLEIDTRDQDGGSGAATRSYQTPLGSDVRIIFATPVGIGAQSYTVDADGSVEFVEQDRVTDASGRIGVMRTDVILNAKSLGDGTAKVRSFDGNGKELSVAFFSIEVADAPDEG